MSLPRYPAYKDSGLEWLGEVPEAWSVTRLKRLACIRYGIGEPPRYQDGGTPLIRATNVDAGRIVQEGMVFVDPDDIPANRITWLSAGDIIVVRSGAYTGDSALIRGEHCPSIAGFDMVLKPLACDASFLQYSLLSNYLKNSQIDLEKLRAAQPHLNAEELGACVVVLPPRSEQPLIAAFLDRETAKIDALIAEQEKLIALLQEKRQAVISHAVTKGLDPNVPMKDSGVEWIGEVPAHWRVVPLKYVASVGNGSTPNRDNPDYWTRDGYPWLSSTVVNKDEVSSADEFVTEKALAECHLPKIVPPAVLVGITGQGRTRGMAAVLTIEATINQHVAYVSPAFNVVNVWYLRRYFDMAYERLRFESDGGGSTKGAITCEQIANLRIPLAPPQEQREIAKTIDDLSGHYDSLMGIAKSAIVLLHERRAALISAAVTGQIDVRSAIDEPA